MSMPRPPECEPAWQPISCEEREAIVNRNGERYGGLGVASGLTDVDGQYGEPLIFTEWYDKATDRSILRDYRYPGRQTPDDPYPDDVKPCQHFAAR